MRAYVYMSDDREPPDPEGAMRTLRAVPGVILADVIYHYRDIVAVIEEASDRSFESILRNLHALGDFTIDEVVMARPTGATGRTAPRA